jgi:hypothetical protein
MFLSIHLYPVYSKCIGSECHCLVSLSHCGPFFFDMDIARPVSSSVSSISFSFLSTEDVRRISVKQIVNPVLLDNLGQPNIGGLYDPALGPATNREM